MQRVDDSGEGRWTVQEAVDPAVPAPVISLAPMMRSRSRQDSSARCPRCGPASAGTWVVPGMPRLLEGCVGAWHRPS
jgi:hypothetical protein